MQKSKYQGVIPAFYACYDDQGRISTERVRKLARHLVNKGVKGLYVGGSSGECIYQEKEERMEILEAVMEEVAAAGYRVVNVDATVICERPKLLPHVPAIRARIAELLRIAVSNVSVKGKTNEGMDAVGRGEGIAVHSVALLEEGAFRD